MNTITNGKIEVTLKTDDLRELAAAPHPENMPSISLAMMKAYIEDNYALANTRDQVLMLTIIKNWKIPFQKGILTLPKVLAA